MLILHHIEELGYTVYIGSSGNKFIFNIVPDESITGGGICGGYTDLLYICRVKRLSPKDIQNIVVKAEHIMGRTVAENLAIVCDG
jgi:hypothetical protein